MATCKECLHFEVCAKEGRLVQIDNHTWDEYNQLDNVEVFCEKYIPADVVPKSEVEELSGKYEDLKLKYADLQKDKDELFAWVNDKKTEVAREILSDLKKQIHDKAVYPYGKDTYSFVNVKVFDAVLNNVLIKYTEGENGGTKNVHDENS